MKGYLSNPVVCPVPCPIHSTLFLQLGVQSIWDALAQSRISIRTMARFSKVELAHLIRGTPVWPTLENAHHASRPTSPQILTWVQITSTFTIKAETLAMQQSYLAIVGEPSIKTSFEDSNDITPDDGTEPKLRQSRKAHREHSRLGRFEAW